MFENVGGAHFEAAFKCLRAGGRIAVCGGIEAYCKAAPSTVAIDQLAMIYTGQRIEGFVCSKWLVGTLAPPFLAEMAAGIKGGTLVVTETVFEGIASWPEAFASLFTSKNSGKVVVRI